jgi:hypothetical protein
MTVRVSDAHLRDRSELAQFRLIERDTQGGIGPRRRDPRKATLHLVIILPLRLYERRTSPVRGCPSCRESVALHTGRMRGDAIEPVMAGRRVLHVDKSGPCVSPIHVHDCARALVHLAERGELGGRYSS